MQGIGVPEPQLALDKIKIVENGDPLVDIRTITGITFRTTPGHEVTPFLRAPVAEMLRKASLLIDPEFRLHVFSAHRDLTMQKAIWDRHYDRYKLAHPEWPEHMLRRMVNRYVAPIDHPAPPGHSTGAAVDVVLQRHDGSFVDVIPPDIDDWSFSHTWTTKIDPVTRGYRMHLVEAMLSVGFSNCRDEYWHYSWGDSGWAVRVGETQCPYGAIDAPEGWK
ncbi:MAG TPA: M15 family metallopeptidase [Verrucomicrobiae bacterium]|nr:M15 family metallopeptidase [Verrucomicrobiae bacterium]